MSDLHSEVLQIIIKFITENSSNLIFTRGKLLKLYGPSSTWRSARPAIDRISDILWHCEYSLLDRLFGIVCNYGVDDAIIAVFNEVIFKASTTEGQQATLHHNYVDECKLI